MKIVMLGFNKVGKTTYMASLYGVLQREFEGFRLKAASSDEHKKLLELADKIHFSKYPLPTDQRSEYEFQLRYQGKDVLPFNWVDYRGGALIETQDSPQAKLLLQDLRQADGIMMFCDCEALAKGNTRSNHIGRMVTLVTHALQDLEHPISLAIILTKFDLINNFYEDMLHPFRGLISAIEVSNSLSGAFIPIACGRRLINVPMPLLFALHKSLIEPASALFEFVYSRFHSNEVQGMWRHRPKTLLTHTSFIREMLYQIPLIEKGMTLRDYHNRINEIKFGGNLGEIISGISQTSVLDPFNAFK